MTENTKAFVLSYLKYGDSSLIIRCYTEKFGFKSFILKNSFSGKRKKNHLLFILNEVDITFYPKKTHSLELIKDMYQGYIFKNTYSDIVKSSIVTFIGEILNQTLKNEEIPNASLYDFLKTNLIRLDDKEHYFADFHLYFLLGLSGHIGFYPLHTHAELPYFNLSEGVFSPEAPHNFSGEENARLWDTLLTYDFNLSQNCFNSSQRTQMLNEILTYYEIHLTNFKRPVSLDILKLIFE
ncbi:MAG: recombination protein O N-terminal domain-containing protein [Flavobacteriaceae bacterium]|jgi:DNA repair protein RecO (recombination protein O)|nr:recombination protein O N-terminal domain-containing protein [Flavobacteriaceae bacterium]